MKKFVKPLIIASSVAAIAGIGAVSFAQWSQGTSTPEEVEGSTGTIVVLGDLTATSDLGSKKLVPYDQVDQFDPESMVKEFTITLEYDGDDGATITMTVNNLADKLEWEKTTGTWEAISTGREVEAGTIKIRLNSSDTDDMEQDFTIKFTVTAPTVED